MNLIAKGYTKAHLKLSAEKNEVSLSFGLPKEFSDYDFLTIDVCTKSGNDLRLYMDFSEDESSEPKVTVTSKIFENCRAALLFPVNEKTFALERCFLNPYPGLRKGKVYGKPCRKSELRFMKLTILSERLDEVEIFGVRCEKKASVVPVKGAVAVDKFGQRISGSWPDKTTDETELVNYLRGEYERARSGGRYPEGWSEYGGWLKKRFTATGYFRIERDERRAWLVDPDGCAFFSNGVCYGNRTGIFTYTDGTEELYEWLPPHEGKFAPAWSTAANIPQYLVRNGREGADGRNMFCFSRANMIRAFGEDWHTAWSAITACRLKRWGFNTVSVGTNDYLDERTEDFLRHAKIPFVYTLKFFPLTEERIFRDFPDVYSEEYPKLCAAYASREPGKVRDNPYFIGYFVTNEPEWLLNGDVNLTERLMAHPRRLRSKEVFIGRLSEKYRSIEALNAAWNTDFAAFDELYIPFEEGDRKSGEAKADFTAFHKSLVAEYDKIIGGELRKAVPDRLNLGMRFNPLTEKTLECKFNFDVFSFNCYGDSPAASAKLAARFTDKPVMIGEWHIGAADRGLSSFGLYGAQTQEERARACLDYCETAALQKNVVGIHYFEYNDHPYLGRFDGECYNIGLADVCGRPYKETEKAFISFAEEMYPILNGEMIPECKRQKIERMR